MKNLALFSAIALLVCSCAVDEMQSPLGKDDSLKSVVAVFPQPEEEGIAVKSITDGPNGYVHKFEAGEKIDIWQAAESTSKMTYSLSAGKDGEMIINIGGYLMYGDYCSLHPSSGSTVTDPTVAEINLAGQTQIESGSTAHLHNVDYMYVANTSISLNTESADKKKWFSYGSFNFERIIAWYKFILSFPDSAKDTPIKSISLVSDNAEFSLAGRFNVTTGAFTATKSDKTMTLALGENGAGILPVYNEETGFYEIVAHVAIMPVDLSASNLTIIAAGEDGVKYESNSFAGTNRSKNKLKILSYNFDNSTVAKIGTNKYETLNAAFAAVRENETIEVINAGTYVIPNSGIAAVPAGVKVMATVDGVVFDCAGSGSIANISNGISFENITFAMGQTEYHGFQHSGLIQYENCVINGYYKTYGQTKFTGCEFNQSTYAYSLNAYGTDLDLVNCTFNNVGKGMYVYNERTFPGELPPYTVNVEGCTFNVDYTGQSKAKAQVFVKNNIAGQSYTVNINGCTVNATGEPKFDDPDLTKGGDQRLWNIEETEAGPASDNVFVNLDGNAVYPTFVAKIGDVEYTTFSDAVAAANEAEVVEILVADTYKIPNLPKNITIKGDVAGVVFDCVGSGSIASVPNGATFENATFNFGQNNYHGFQGAGTIDMKDCTLNGLLFSYGDMNFNGCTFNQDKAEYMMWAYGKDLTYTDCIFNGKGKFINVYCEGNSDVYNVTATGCTFNSDTNKKAAFNVKETCGEKMLKYNVVISNCTANENFPEAKEDNLLLVIDPLVQVDDRNLTASESGITVTLDGVKVYPVAKPSVAKIGDTEYATLAEAFAAAKSGDEIILCKDIENIGKTMLPAGVALNGNGHAVIGNSAIDINAEGGTVTNVKFQNIHNAENKLSAVYASNLTGAASVIGCTFDNCDWDAIQIEPKAGADITIKNNTFNDNAEDGVQQQRFVHVQSAKNVDFSATITENILIGDTKQGALECYYFAVDTKVNVSKNYIEDMADVCVLKAEGTFASEMVFPAYVDAEKSATYSPAVMIQTSAYTAEFFNTLAEAAAAVTASSNTVKLLADCEDTSMVTFKNDVTIEGNGKTITGSPIDFAGASTTIKNVVFNNGKEAKESASYFRSANVKNVIIDGCTFNDAKWDALQITSNTLQNVSITNCVFSNQSAGKRYIHIQPSVVLNDAKVTITGNTFNNVTKDYVDDSAVTIYMLMLSNMTIEDNKTTGAGAGVLTTDEFWINNGADASDLMSQADVCKAFGGDVPAEPQDAI